MQDFHYTIYDALNRIIEVGKISSVPIGMSESLAKNDSIFKLWLAACTKTEITRTYYDSQHFTLQGFVQENLRSRVVSITYSDIDDTVQYNSASHYSYDISGNVKTLIQENKSLDIVNRGLKRIDYDYDLVSGKVNLVSYQADSLDQFFQKYTYDADNRIIEVFTSRDGLLWDRDAFYSYYMHGPLARIELGEQKVQGLDYAYTLQGWLKGINSGNNSPYTEMGQDGKSVNSGPIQPFSRDAFGFNLGYFYHDYAPIGGDSFEMDYNPSGGSSFGDASFDDGSGMNRGLYNGNIRHSVLSIDSVNYPHIGYVYNYDQLNRLKGQTAFTGMDTINSKWNNGGFIDDYQESVQYDPNGNILSYLRNGTTSNSNPLGMDSLTYNYDSNTNKLNHVDDVVGSGNYSIDIDDQSSNNYSFDESGNLIGDVQEGLDITWNNAGKVDSIVNSNSGVKLKFRYDPMGNRIEKRVYQGSDVTNTIYTRDAQGNIMACYTLTNEDTLRMREFDMYGSSRLGVLNDDTLITCLSCSSAVATNPVSAWIGNKQYELTNHLGNVLATITDKKVYFDSTGNSVADWSVPEISSVNDYYPFGMVMPGRAYTSENYRFGFNGKENDDEVKGNGNQQDYGFRIYDTRLGRFLSVDPITNEYPGLSPYQFAGNTPIAAADLDGLEPDIKFESGHSAQMIGGKGVDKKEYNQAFDRMSGDGGIVVGMASALGLRGLVSFYNFLTETPPTAQPGTPSNNPEHLQLNLRPLKQMLNKWFQ